MSRSAPLLNAVNRLADRFRAMPQSRLMAASGGGEAPAEAGFALAGRLAESAQRLETPDRPPRPLPRAGAFSVGDQIAVAGHDLALAIENSEGGAGDKAEKVLEEALRDIADTARRI